MRKILSFALIVAAGAAGAASQAVTLDASLRTRLDALAVGADIVIDGFPDGYGGQTALQFKRIEVYAPGARIVVVDEHGEHELPRSRRVELIGASASGEVRASLAFDPQVENLSGVGSSPAGSFAISTTTESGATRIHSLPMEQTLPAGVTPRIEGGNDALPSGRAPPDAMAIALAGLVPSGTLRGALIAIDTDNEFMSERFSNNTTAATNWIADLFGAMNVMYQRDLNVTLQQGTTFLRTTTDPYTQTTTSSQLTEFGSYWQSHYAAVPRAFAALLSGKAVSGNSASGIAWINAYCETQSQGGGYSVTQTFTNPQVNVSYSALIIGHELGHNFGAFHTHCTNIANGSAPTGSNTIDKCRSGESVGTTSCYVGTESCPASGPGAPAGTIMSYCNQIGCGPDQQNVLQFHPTQISVLNALIAQNTPSCLSPNGGDVIFRNGFD